MPKMRLKSQYCCDKSCLFRSTSKHMPDIKRPENDIALYTLVSSDKYGPLPKHRQHFSTLLRAVPLIQSKMPYDHRPILDLIS